MGGQRKLLSTHLDKLLKKEEHCFSALRVLKNDQEGIAVEDQSNNIYKASLMLITEKTLRSMLGSLKLRNKE